MLVLILISISAHAAEQILEPVHYLTPEQADRVLADAKKNSEARHTDTMTAIALGSEKHASKLLGDYSQITPDLLNSLPATAAGLEPVLYISSKQAEAVLGDTP